jgi:uncharacterized protein
MKFVVDIMLGKLAKYLRMAGQDVFYSNTINDDEILEIARNENRIVLTRDTLMLQRRECINNSIHSLLVIHDNILNKLKQVEAEFKIKMKPNLVRCVECNEILEKVTKDEIPGKVPPYVFKTQKNFLHCRKCDKYYWQGTHFKNISNTFKIINNKY